MGEVGARAPNSKEPRNEASLRGSRGLPEGEVGYAPVILPPAMLWS